MERLGGRGVGESFLRLIRVLRPGLLVRFLLFFFWFGRCGRRLGRLKSGVVGGLERGGREEKDSGKGKGRVQKD